MDRERREMVGDDGRKTLIDCNGVRRRKSDMVEGRRMISEGGKGNMETEVSRGGESESNACLFRFLPPIMRVGPPTLF